MRASNALLFVAAFVAMSAYARQVTPAQFSASYRMMEDPGEIVPVSACAIAGNVVVEDSRAAKREGERAHEDNPSVKQPISMTGSVVDWAGQGFATLAARAVLRTDVSRRPVITIRVADLWIDEIVYRRAEYDARVVLDVSIGTNPFQVCFEKRVDGFAENYGYAGKAENYQETINQALDRAILKLLSSSEFSEALCKCGESAPR